MLINIEKIVAQKRFAGINCFNSLLLNQFVCAIISKGLLYLYCSIPKVYEPEKNSFVTTIIGFISIYLFTLFFFCLTVS